MVKTTIKNWSREAVIALIEVYRNKPCLYNIKSVDYRDREKGRDALEEMVAVVSEFHATVTEEDCKKKYQSLRNQFCKEYTKVLAARSNSDSDLINMYNPKLWCYEQLLFLKESIHQKKGTFIGCSPEEMMIKEEMNVEYWNEDVEDYESLSEIMVTTPKTEKRMSEVVPSAIPAKKSNPGVCADKSSPIPGSSQGTTSESESLGSRIQMYTKKREEKRAVNSPINKYTAFGNFVGSWLHDTKNKNIRKKCMIDIINVITKYEIEDSDSD